jgi:hypothetical protein
MAILKKKKKKKWECGFWANKKEKKKWWLGWRALGIYAIG